MPHKLQRLEKCHTNVGAWKNAAQVSANFGDWKMLHKLQRLGQCHTNFGAWKMLHKL
jgi:hypothetical protein